MTFWTYKDANGVDVVVQRFEDVPAQYRGRATTLDAASMEKVKRTTDLVGHAPADIVAHRPAFSLDMPSFVAGAGSALFVAMIVFVLFRRRSRLVGMMLGALLMTAVAVGYLTYVRQSAGLGAGSIGTPTAIIEDAKNATEALKKQMEKQEAALREVGK